MFRSKARSIQATSSDDLVAIQEVANRKAGKSRLSFDQSTQYRDALMTATEILALRARVERMEERLSCMTGTDGEQMQWIVGMLKRALGYTTTTKR